MTSDHIRYHYDELQDIVRRFRAQGDRAEALIRRVMHCLRLMDDGAWIGEGADEYREELETLVLPAVRRLASVLGDSGWVVDRAADTMREAEEYTARLFQSDGGTPLQVNFSSVGLAGRTFGSFGGFTDGEIRRLGNIFGFGGGGGFGGRRDDLSAVDVIDNEESVEKRFGGFGNRYFERARRIIENWNPDIPPTLPGIDGPVVTPPWFTEHSADDGGLNGAADAAVMVTGAGDHERLTGDIAKTSQALGGAQVSGVFAMDEDSAVRGPGAVAGQNVAVTTLSPAAQALMDWVRKHPNGLFILPPWSAAAGVEALQALDAEGFDLSNLNVVTFGDASLDIPDSVAHHREITGFPDLRA